MPKLKRPTRNFFSLTHPMGKSCVIKNKVWRGGVKKFWDFFLGRQRAKRRFLPLFFDFFATSAKTKTNGRPIFSRCIEGLLPQLLVPPRINRQAQKIRQGASKSTPVVPKCRFFAPISQPLPRRQIREKTFEYQSSYALYQKISPIGHRFERLRLPIHAQKYFFFKKSQKKNYRALDKSNYGFRTVTWVGLRKKIFLAGKLKKF